MASRPAVTRPSLAWFLVLDGGIAALAALALNDRAHRAAAEALPLPPRPVLQKLLAGTAAAHVAEGLYAHRLARRHGLPAGRWAGQTLLVGFPSTLALCRVVRA
ncbi:MAG TPA: DUF4499 domain-containing protein [Acidimicrobiales bacterium]|nr:DUF4499 domain-containing protein [Acidimicrobiales bacterium]